MSIDEFIERDDVFRLENTVYANRTFVISNFEHMGEAWTWKGKTQAPGKSYKTIAKDQKGLVTSAITVAGMFCLAVRYLVDKKAYRAIYWGDVNRPILELRKIYY